MVVFFEGSYKRGDRDFLKESIYLSKASKELKLQIKVLNLEEVHRCGKQAKNGVFQN